MIAEISGKIEAGERQRDKRSRKNTNTEKLIMI
jgi:hypothetical protein